MQGFEHFRLLSPTWRDLLEVALVAFVMYRVLLLFQRVHAVRIAEAIREDHAVWKEMEAMRPKSPSPFGQSGADFGDRRQQVTPGNTETKQ